MGLRERIASALGQRPEAVDAEREHGWYPLSDLSADEHEDPRVAAALESGVIGFLLYHPYEAHNQSDMSFAQEYERLGGERLVTAVFDDFERTSLATDGKAIRKASLPLPVLQRAEQDGFASAGDLLDAQDEMEHERQERVAAARATLLQEGYGAVDVEITQKLADRILPTLGPVDAPHWHDEREVPHSPVAPDPGPEH
jgi:hypothetical protein